MFKLDVVGNYVLPDSDQVSKTESLAASVCLTKYEVTEAYAVPPDLEAEAYVS